MSNYASWLGPSSLPSRNAQSFASMMKMTLSQMEYLRKYNYVKYWKFYLGQHWLFPQTQGDSQITVNYIKAGINVKLYFLFGKGIEFRVPEGMDAIKQRLDKVWGSQQRRKVTCFHIGQLGFVSGDAPIKLAIDKKYNQTKIIPVYSSYVDPIWSDESSDTNLDMESCTIVHPQYGQIDDENGDIKVTKEILLSDKTIIQDPYNESQPEKVIPNDLDEVNMVWIRNWPISGYYYGFSDIADWIGLQTEYNEKLTDIADIVNYHSSPTTLVYGAKYSNLDKSSRKVWSGLPKDARVENLELLSDLGASINFLEKMRDNMGEVSFIPTQLLGKQQEISNTSAAALHLQYFPMTMDRDGKIVFYGEGIARVNRMILDIERKIEDAKPSTEQNKEFISQYDELAKEPIGDVVETIFPDVLPKDQLMEIDKVMREMDAGLESKESALLRLGTPQDKIKKKLQEIVQDKLTDAQLDQIIFAATGQSEAGIQQPDSMGEGMLTSEELPKRIAESDRKALQQQGI